MTCDEILGSGALCEPLKDKFDRDARTTKDGFPKHRKQSVKFVGRGLAHAADVGATIASFVESEREEDPCPRCTRSRREGRYSQNPGPSKGDKRHPRRERV